MFKVRLRILISVLMLVTASFSYAQPPSTLPENARVELDGTLEVFIREDLQRGTAEHEFFLNRGPDTPPIRLLFNSGVPSDMRSGIGIAVRGVVRNGRVEVEAANLDVSSSEPQPSSSAEAAILNQRTALVVVLNLTDASHLATELENMPGYYFGTDQSMKDMYDKASFGQLVIIGDVDNANGDGIAEPDGFPDVFGPIESTRSTAEICANPFTYVSEFLAAAEILGVDPELYQHRIFALPKGMSCGWTGYANVGCGSTCNAFNRWSQDLNTTSHEMGHNLGMAHAGKDTDGNGILEGGEQYSDFSSFMGYSLSSGVRAVDAAHHWQMAWYQNYDGFSTELVATSGQYSIAPLQETQPAVTAPSILRINVGNGRPYFLSVRQALGYDTDLPSINSAALNGVNIHRYDGSGYDKTWLIDQLSSDESYTDSVNNLTITQVGGKDASGVATVNIDLGDGECIESLPGLNLTPSFATVGPDTSYTYSVTVTNNVSTSCGAQTFTLIVDAVVFDSLSVAPGAQSSTDLIIPGSNDGGDINFTVSTVEYSEVTAEGTLTVDATAPSEVTNLSGTYAKKGKNHRIQLGWTGSASADIASYDIERGGSWIANTTQSNYTHTFSGTISTSYNYTVRAVDNVENVSSGKSTDVDTSGDDTGGGGNGGGGNGGGGNGGGGGRKPK